MEKKRNMAMGGIIVLSIFFIAFIYQQPEEDVPLACLIYIAGLVNLIKEF